MKKRIVAILSMVSMLTLVISPDTAAKMKAADNKKDTEEYIVKVDDTQQYNDYSKEWNKENKRVVNHKEQDEKYLNKVQSAAVELSKDEVKDYQEDDSLTVEKNYQLQASSTEEEPRAIAVEAKIRMRERVSTPTIRKSMCHWKKRNRKTRIRRSCHGTLPVWQEM